MALLQNDNVQYYHPLDNETEHINSIVWGNTLGEFATSILTSGYRKAGAAGTARLQSPTNNDYTDLSGYTSACILFWGSGLWDAGVNNKRIIVGHGDAGSDPSNGITVTRSLSSASVSLSQRNLTIGSKTLTTFPTDSGWKLCIVDARLDGSSWRMRVSFSGQNWTDLGTLGDTQLFDDDPRAIISNFRGTSVTAHITDEVVLWGNNDLFTSGELQNLYNLYVVHSGTMDEYSQFFPTSINNDIDLFINGFNNSSGNISLYIPGQLETDRLDLFISGVNPNNNLNLFINGVGFISGSLGLAVPQTPTSGNIDLSVPNIHDFENNSCNLFISGPILSSGNCNLFLENKWKSNDLDLFIFNQYYNDNIALFIYGIQTGQWDLFAAVDDNLSSNELNLFINGIPSGSSGEIFFINNDINLFIRSEEQVESVSDDWSIFVQTESGIVFNYNQDFNLFVQVGGVADNSIAFYIFGHASGDIDHGIEINDNINLFTEGLGDSGSENFIPFSGIWSLFARVTIGSSSNINLFIDGFSFPSGVCNLFTFGIIDNINEDLELYILGSEGNINNSTNLFIGGIIDDINNNLNLFIFTNSDIIQDNIELYIHGF